MSDRCDCLLKIVLRHCYYQEAGEEITPSSCFPYNPVNSHPMSSTRWTLSATSGPLPPPMYSNRHQWQFFFIIFNHRNAVRFLQRAYSLPVNAMKAVNKCHWIIVMLTRWDVLNKWGFTLFCCQVFRTFVFFMADTGGHHTRSMFMDEF